MRGVGEGGAIVGPPALVNAIADALSPFGEMGDVVLPLTPARVLDRVEGRDISGHTAHAAPVAAPTAPVATPVATAPAASIDGAWAMRMSTPMGMQEMVGHFRTEGTALSGELESAEGSQGFTGTVEGSRLKFDLAVEKPMKITLKYDLMVEGDSISGKVKMGMFGSSKISGERA